MLELQDSIRICAWVLTSLMFDVPSTEWSSIDTSCCIAECLQIYVLWKVQDKTKIFKVVYKGQMRMLQVWIGRPSSIINVNLKTKKPFSQIFLSTNEFIYGLNTWNLWLEHEKIWRSPKELLFWCKVIKVWSNLRSAVKFLLGLIRFEWVNEEHESHDGQRWKDSTKAWWVENHWRSFSQLALVSFTW